MANLTTFKNLTQGQEIKLASMAFSDFAVVEEIKEDGVLVKWEDGTKEEISLNKEVELVSKFINFSCGFQAII